MVRCIMGSYRAALAAAIAAAREAGALLRRDLHRSGGPRGEGSHADADDEAERILRDRLLAAAPYRWLGEESGRHDPEGVERHAPIWIVDPNDGTSAFLRGHRGSSVSIAVVHRGVPVLGVVYAFAWPDDRGELVAWAEGEALTLDGEPLTLDVSGRALDRSAVIAVSQDADRNSEANARCVADARFLALPSIAHRLARIGTGEAQGAVCLSGIASWDVAAGHALVRAANGVVVDEQGRELRYDEEGNCSARWCFAGSRAIVDALRVRPWDDVRRRDADAFPFVRPRRDAKATEPQLSRAQRALVAFLSSGGSMEQARAWDRRALDALDDRAVARAERIAVLTHRPTDRPKAAWTVDALELAEAMLI